MAAANDNDDAASAVSDAAPAAQPQAAPTEEQMAALMVRIADLEKLNSQMSVTFDPADKPPPNEPNGPLPGDDNGGEANDKDAAAAQPGAIPDNDRGLAPESAVMGVSPAEGEEGEVEPYVGVMVVEYGETTAAIPADAVCSECMLGHNGAPLDGNCLFQPCECLRGYGRRYFHRECFRKWRTGWINPRNYWICPDCMFYYNIERIRPEREESESKQRIKSRFQSEMLKMWAVLISTVVAFVAFWCLVCYYADRENKNIPVGMKFMHTSVIYGWPPENAEEKWREEFKRPDVWVWPYYLMFSLLITSICVLLLFCFAGCTFDEDERKRRSCQQQCHCYPGDAFYIAWCCAESGEALCTCCTKDEAGDACCECKDCHPNECCRSLGDAKEFAIIIVLIIIVAVLVSAVFVIIFFGLRKGQLIHDRMSEMIINQSCEQEGDTVVLGKGESVRPENQV
jgi:hypothetical protein